MAAVTAQYSNSLVSLFNLHKPEYANFLFRKYGQQGVTAFQFLQSLGAVTPVAQGTFSHFEEDWITATFSANANVGDPGAGNTISIQVLAAEIDALGNYYPRLNDIVMFNNGVKAQIITDNGTGLLGIRPLKSTDNIGAVTAGEPIIIISNAFAEGTNQPEGRVSDVFEYSYNTQILKESIDSTGTELTNQIWPSSIDGTSIQGWFDKAKSIDLDYRMALAIDGMILHGVASTNTGILGSTSQGLVDDVTTSGGNATYTPGLFSVSYFDQMNRYLDKQMAPNEYVGLLGYQLFQDLENTLSNVFAQNPIIFAGGGKTFGELMFGDKASKVGNSVEIGFRSITKTDRTFHLLKLSQLSNPKLYGATGFTESGRGIFLPLDKPTAPRGGRMPRLGVRYKELGGYSRKMEAWVTGGAGNLGVKTNTNDSVQLHQRCEMGSERFGVNTFYQFTVA